MKHIFFVLCLSLLLVSCGKTVKTETHSVVNEASSIAQNTPAQQDPLANTSEALSFKDMISMIKDNYKEDTTFSSCMQSASDMCIQEVSFTSGKELVCDDLLLESNIQNCENSKKLMQAKETGDISLCDTLEWDKESCRYEVVLTKGLETLDVTICEGLSDSYIIACHNEIIRTKAKSEKDLSICEEIRSYNENEEQNFEVQFCKDEVTFLIEEAKMIEQQEALQRELEQTAIDQPIGE